MAGRRATRPAEPPRTEPSPITIREREARRDQLAQRLEDGCKRIEEATLSGRDVKAWEDFWLSLLREYEDVCDGLMESLRV